MELQIEKIEKRYGDVAAVHGITLRLKPGVTGLLGPNGAGKSTLMRVVATIAKPTNGTVLWNGVDVNKKPNELRQVLGYLPQDFGVYPNLNAIEFLQYMAALKGVTGKAARQRIDELLKLVNLTDAAKQPIGGYSGGMKQRVGIAQALLNDPQLLIVDEPTVGLDPEERVHFRNLLSDLSDNRIVIFSTHIVSDLEATASEIAVIRKGELLKFATPEEIVKDVEGKVWEVMMPSDKLREVEQKWLISGTIRRTDGMQVRVVADHTPAPEAKHVPPTLEDAYLYLTATSTKEVA